MYVLFQQFYNRKIGAISLALTGNYEYKGVELIWCVSIWVEIC